MPQRHLPSTPCSEPLQPPVPPPEEQAAPKASEISVEQRLQLLEERQLKLIDQDIAVRFDELEQQINWLVSKVKELSFLIDRNQDLESHLSWYLDEHG